MYLICLKVLAQDFGVKVRWLGDRDIATLLYVLDDSFGDQVLSGRYLCHKFILQLVARYINSDQVENYSQLFSLIGMMPLELFSA